MKLLRKLLLAAGIGVVGLSATGCFGDRISSGQVGLLINEYGDSATRGVENAEFIRSGRVWYNSVNRTLVRFQTSVVKYSFTDNPEEQSTVPEAVGFSVAGVRVAEDVAVSIRFNISEEGKYIKQYYDTYRLDPFTFITTHLRDELRGAFNDAVVQLNIRTPAEYNQRRIEVLAKVQELIEDEFEFILVENIEFLDVATYPENIQESINNQFQAEQRAKAAQSEQLAAEAEAQTELIKVRAEVQQEQERAKLATDPNYLRLLELELRELELTQWNGQHAPVIQTPNVQLAAPEQPE